MQILLSEHWASSCWRKQTFSQRSDFHSGPSSNASIWPARRRWMLTACLAVCLSGSELAIHLEANEENKRSAYEWNGQKRALHCMKMSSNVEGIGIGIAGARTPAIPLESFPCFRSQPQPPASGLIRPCGLSSVVQLWFFNEKKEKKKHNTKRRVPSSGQSFHTLVN